MIILASLALRLVPLALALGAIILVIPGHDPAVAALLAAYGYVGARVAFRLSVWTGAVIDAVLGG